MKLLVHVMYVEHKAVRCHILNDGQVKKEEKVISRVLWGHLKKIVN